MIRPVDQRASDADREAVVELLRTAAGDGRIDHDELDERLSRALSARTYRQLYATVDDIPRDRGAGNRRTPQRTVAGWTVNAVRSEPWLLVLMIPVVMITLTVAAVVMMVWLVCIIAVLALGRNPRHPTTQFGRRRPGQMSRVPGSHRGIAGSGWRWI